MKKLFVLCLLSFVFCKSVEVLAYTQADISNAQFLADQWIIVKQSTTTGYRLDSTITRAELVGIALKLKWVTLPSYQCKWYFSDVRNNDWICRAVELAADNSLVTRANTKFRPQEIITNSEALAIILAAGWISIDKNIGVSEDFKYVDSDGNISKDWQSNVGETARKYYILRVNSESSDRWEWDWVYFWDFNRAATRAEVFDFVTRILRKDGLRWVQVSGPYTRDGSNGYVKIEYGKYIEVPISWINVENMYKWYACSIREDETAYNYGNTWPQKFWNFNAIGANFGSSKAVYIPRVGWWYYLVVSYDNNLEDCTNITLFWARNVNSIDVLRIYYDFLDTNNHSGAYSMRSPVWVTKAVFESWYSNFETRIVFRENTLKSLWDNTYEFLIDMDDGKMKSTYRIKSKVNLDNFTINNISSVKQ